MLKAEILKKFKEVVGHDSAKARQLIKKLDYRNDPYLLACISLTYFDESAFRKDGTQRKRFINGKLTLAEKYAIMAYEINHDHSEVLYNMGKIRNALNQKDLAIYCFKKIVQLGVRHIMNKEDREIWYAKMKVNDSKFQLYRLYYDIGELTLSKRYLAMYKGGLKKGIQTIYKPLERFLMDSSGSSLFVVNSR